MAIKFGMTLAQIFNQLVRGYQKIRGTEPKGLDLIKIKQEALQRFKDMNKVVDMKGNVLDSSKPIMGGTQEGAALRSGIMKATGAKPVSVKTRNRPGVFGLEDYDISKMSSIKKEIIKTEQKLGNLNPDTPGFRERAKPLIDKLTELQKKLRDDKAMGGRIGLKEGEGVMQMASAPDIMDERNEMSLRMFNKPIDVLTPEEMDILEEEIMRLMEKFSKVDRGAPSITLADGGRAAFKDGLLAKLRTPFKIDRGTLRSMFFNKNNPIITGFNTSELFDLVSNLSSLPGLAEGGRIGYKDGPRDPKRRTFMKAAAGLASLLPFGIGKVSKVAAPVVTKAAEITAPALDKIVETVMSLGKLVSLKGKRVKEMVTKKKHQGVEVTEDIQDQSYIIKKGNKEIYYKPGRQDETGGFEDDIIEVIEDRIKKAGGGGIGYMLGE
jgi:hypothetical protein